jgi:hypothetical protein
MLRNDVFRMMETLTLGGMLAVYDEMLANGRKRRLTPERVILNKQLLLGWGIFQCL